MTPINVRTVALSGAIGVWFIAVERYAGGCPQYGVTNLGSFATNSAPAKAYGINDSGQVVGFSGTPQVFGTGAFRTAGNTQSGPATLVYPNDLLSDVDTARKINNAGQVAGYNANGQATLTTGNTTTTIGNFPYTFASTAGHSNAINNAGQVAGYLFSNNQVGAYHAFVYNSVTPQLQDLGALSTDAANTAQDRSEATSINDSGVAVGWTYTNGVAPGQGNLQQHAFKWTQGGGMTDLGTLTIGQSVGNYSFANDINSSGTVVGYAINPVTVVAQAVTWSSSGVITNLDPNGNSNALAINDSGVIVGGMNVGGINHAMVYTGGTMYDINSLINATDASHWLLYEADDINSSGQIVGWGLYDSSGTGNFSGNTLRPFELTLLPEPTSAGMLLIGASAMTVARRRTRPR